MRDEVGLQVLVCEKCGKIYPANFSGLRCEKEGCGGKLIPAKIQGTEQQ